MVVVKIERTFHIMQRVVNNDKTVYDLDEKCSRIKRILMLVFYPDLQCQDNVRITFKMQ